MKHAENAVFQVLKYYCSHNFITNMYFLTLQKIIDKYVDVI